MLLFLYLLQRTIVTVKINEILIKFLQKFMNFDVVLCYNKIDYVIEVGNSLSHFSTKGVGVRIIGIDPGTAICGYGIIDVKGSKLTPVAYGAITTPKELTDSQRLEILFNDLSDILEEHKPDKFGVEELFFNRNVTTAIKVGQARGVILLAAEQQRIPIYEYTPLQIKQAVTGYGKADKNQVIYMTMNILGIREKIKPDDTADALAVAICTAHSSHNDRLKRLV